MENHVRFPHLLRSEVLEGLDTGFRKAFLNGCKVEVFQKPAMVYEQGEASDGMRLIAHGYVDVTYIGEDGQQIFLSRERMGSSMGELEAISEEPCTATCTTPANCTLLYCPKPQLFEALKNIDFIKNMARIFQRRQVHDNWHSHISQFGAVGERLRGYLYMLSRNTNKVVETQSYLAAVVGCSRQTVNRELARLRDAGVIAQNGSEIIVLDRAALSEGLIS